MRRMLLPSFLALALVQLTPVFTSAQTSVGFSHPENTSNLLDYRLPAWGYHIWDADFQLNGYGRDESTSGNTEVSNQFNTNFGSDYSRHFESEQGYHQFSLGLSGGYDRNHNGDESGESSSHDFDAEYNLSGNLGRYLGEGPFSVLASLGSNRRYRERITTSRSGDTSNEIKDYRRTSLNDLTAGIGWGRVRSVIPLIRAQRMSERLTALGRSPLSPTAVRQVAEVLAAQSGYRQVFDRHDRHFWEDVLEPVLAEGTSLSPYEIYYLAEVLAEDVGVRNQGYRLQAQWGFQQYSSFPNSVDYDHSRSRRVQMDFIWSHNLSLDHQISCRGTWRYSWDNRANFDYALGTLDFTAQHLWNLANRHLLQTSLAMTGSTDIDQEGRRTRARLNSTLVTYIEDQLSLNATLGLNYGWNSFRGNETWEWSWSYSLGLVYHLDRLLL